MDDSIARDKFTMKKNKIKVRILIPNTKESIRLPNKNRLLRHFTLDWLQEELSEMDKDKYEVQVIELRNSKVKVDTSEDKRYSYKIKALFCPDEVSQDMRPLLEWAEMRLESSIIILLQLTQPIRRKGLLSAAINQIQANDGYLVTSYIKKPFQDAWRVCRDNRWDEEMRHSKEPHLKLYDGAIYAWYNFTEAWKIDKEELSKYYSEYQIKLLGEPEVRRYYGNSFFVEGSYNSALLWNYKKDKILIYNYTGEVIDIDTKEDLERFRQIYGN